MGESTGVPIETLNSLVSVLIVVLILSAAGDPVQRVMGSHVTI